MENILIKYHVPDMIPIEMKEGGDWIDLRVATDCYVQKGHSYLIPLGVSMKLPDGYEAYLAPRSSTFKKYGILQTNGIGIIDSSDIPLYAYETSGASMLDFGVDDGWQHLFYLRCADRFFTSTISKVLQAEYYVNRNLMMGHPVSLADFTILLGLEPDRGETEVGWPIIDELCWVDFSHYVAKSGDKCYPREFDLPEECPFDPDIFVIDCYFDPVAEYNYE